MCKHEEKNCPRCQAGFECKVGSILLCQCAAVQLNEEERSYLQEHFDDCLCANCMQDLKTEYHNQAFKQKLNRTFGDFFG
jgi:hypothetical protein